MHDTGINIRKINKFDLGLEYYPKPLHYAFQIYTQIRAKISWFNHIVNCNMWYGC